MSRVRAALAIVICVAFAVVEGTPLQAFVAGLVACTYLDEVSR